MIFDGQKKNISIKDIAFFVGFTATVVWAFASYYSIKANKARLAYLKKQTNNE